ncbi:MAG: ABC transporter permease [Acidobacteriaceae bacterium]|nr:ABC transporter permease [Acidobacteriaceae bacterium]
MLRWFKRRKPRDEDIEDELNYHLEMLAKDNLDAGESPVEARLAARRRLGNRSLIKEATREMWTWTSLERLGQDLRIGLRGLAKTPGFTAVAVSTLALGIGANTAMFTVINAALLRTLPARDPERLVILSNPEAHGIGVGDGSGPRYMYAYSEFEALRDHNQVFSGLCAVDSSVRRSQIVVQGAAPTEESEQADVSMVSGDYFSVLGIRAYRGRTFTAEVDKAPHANPVAVISHNYWRNRFALDPSVIGRKIRIRRTTFDIIGVAQAGFSGETVGVSSDIWVPLSMQNEVFPAWTDFLEKPLDPLQKIFWLQLIARLKPGVTLSQAQSGIHLTLRQIRQAEVTEMSVDRRREYLNFSIKLTDGSRGATNLGDSVRDPLTILMAVVGLVLLIACANVANLLAARGARRQREIAVRLALGAGRRRLLQQLLIESMLLAMLGGALGLVLARWGASLLVRMVSTESHRVFLDLHPDPGVLAFTLGISLLTGLLFGLAPGFRATRLDLNAALKGSAKGTVSRELNHGRMPAGRILVAGQIALSLSVLIVAGLFLHSFQKLTKVNPGFDHDHILEFNVGFLESSGYKGPAVHRVHKELLERLREIPQVKGATLAFMGLFVGNDTGDQISVDGSKPHTDSEHSVRKDLVPANHFADIGQPLLMGREFNNEDEHSSQLVGVINQALANKYFPNANPIGRRIWFGHDHPQQFVVIGVVADSKHNSVREPTVGEFWMPFFNAEGDEPSFCTFQVRYTGNRSEVVAAIRAAVKAAAPAVPPIEVRTMNELMGESLTTQRLISQLSSFFGVLALTLAAIGLYGVMAYNVASKTNEIGIRVAIGALPRDILSNILKETVLLVGLGVAFGLPSIWISKRWISSQLFGLSSLDPLVIALAVLVLTVVTVVAGFIPARWASRIDPVAALRYE